LRKFPNIFPDNVPTNIADATCFHHLICCKLSAILRWAIYKTSHHYLPQCKFNTRPPLNFSSFLRIKGCGLTCQIFHRVFFAEQNTAVTIEVPSQVTQLILSYRHWPHITAHPTPAPPLIQGSRTCRVQEQVLFMVGDLFFSFDAVVSGLMSCSGGCQSVPIKFNWFFLEKKIRKCVILMELVE
jgi:hypothetical protein